MLAERSCVKIHRKSRSICAALITCLLFMCSYQSSKSPLNHSNPNHNTLHCPQNPLSKDTLVVLRTGATEILEKLPVQLNTVLRCIPNHIIFSDYEEEIEGHHVHDVFDELNDDLMNSVPDFGLYHQLKTNGRGGLALEGTDHGGSGPSGSLGNPGWKLDKFKFLPMMDKALRQMPQAKWFVFAELDTYLMWGNLLDYLSNFDAEKPYYIGKQMFIGDVLFAHGGSGFVLSAPALRRLTQHWRTHMAEYNQYTIEQWAGDMILGKALDDVSIPLLLAFPHFQGDPVSTLDHNITKINRQPWCYPAITYHHMNGDEIRSLWEFEQEWQRTHAQGVLLRHAEVFKKYVYSSLKEQKTNWDNFSVNSEFSKHALREEAPHTSFEACRLGCESNGLCLQFSYRTGSCLVSNEVRLGRSARSQCSEYSAAASKCDKIAETGTVTGVGSASAVRSGWMMHRLAQYMNTMDQTCSERLGWIM